MPERPSKRSRQARDGPSAEVLADRLHNERVDFACSQGDAQICIVASNFSDKAFGKLLRKVSEASKGLVNRNSKIAAADIRAVSKEQAEIGAAAAAAAKASSKPHPSEASPKTKAMAVPSQPRTSQRLRRRWENKTPPARSTPSRSKLDASKKVAGPKHLATKMPATCLASSSPSPPLSRPFRRRLVSHFGWP